MGPFGMHFKNKSRSLTDGALRAEVIFGVAVRTNIRRQKEGFISRMSRAFISFNETKRKSMRLWQYVEYLSVSEEGRRGASSSSLHWIGDSSQGSLGAKEQHVNK